MNVVKHCLLELSSRQDMTITVTDSQQLWLPAQDQYKTKPIYIPTGEGLMRNHLSLREYWQLIIAEGKRVIFFSGMKL